MEGEARNRVIGSFCSCAQWEFKNEMASVARHSEHKEVSCGRAGCAGEEGSLTSLSTSKPRGSSGYSLHFWKVFFLSLPLAKQQLSFLCPHPSPDAQSTHSRDPLHPHTHTAAAQLQVTSWTRANLEPTSVGHFIIIQSLAEVRPA